MTVESLEKNIRAGMFFYKDGVWSSERPEAAFRTDIVRQKCPALTASMWMIPISLYLCSLRGEWDFAETLL